MNNARLVKIKDDIFPLAVLFVLPIIYLSGALFSSVNLLGDPAADITVEVYSKTYGYNELSKFSIPLWNPYKFSGMPYVATLHPSVFYPLNLIFLFLPVSCAINWSITIHLFLSGAFTYYLLKHYDVNRLGSTVAGIVYMFAAPHVLHIYAGHFIVLNAIIWTPLMFLFLDRLVKGEGLKYGIFLSFTIALQLLAGQPQYLFYSMIALSLYLLFMLVQRYFEGSGQAEIASKLFLFSAAVILGLTLSAVQILPTAEMTKYSTRENLSYEFVSMFSFPPENLITYLIPDFFGDMLKTPYWGKNYLWEMSSYVGIMPLILAVISLFFVRNRVVWFFASLAGFSIILALGKHTPLLKLLYSYVPGFNLFRGNSKWIFLNAFSLAVLSGFGADFIIKVTNGARKSLRILISVFCLLSTVSLLAIYAFFDDVWFRKAIDGVIASGDLFSNPKSFIQRGFEAVATASFRSDILWTAVYLISGSALFLLYLNGKLKDSALKLFLAAIIVFDLFSFGTRYMVTFDSRKSHWDKSVIGFLKQDREPFRVVAPEMGVNSGMAAGIETLGGYDTIMIKRYSEFINFSQKGSPDKPDLSVDINYMNKLTDMMNARYLVLPSMSRYYDPAFEVVFDDGRNRVYQNLNALPRAFIVHSTKVIKERDSIFLELSSPEFNPAISAIIEETPDEWHANAAAKSPVPRFISYSPNRILIDAYLNAPGLLVLGEVWYPGWKAFVDGKETRIYKTNYVMRGLVLSEGRHTVEFRYDPLLLKIGALISSAGLIFMAAFLIWDRRRSEKLENPA